VVNAFGQQAVVTVATLAEVLNSALMQDVAGMLEGITMPCPFGLSVLQLATLLVMAERSILPTGSDPIATPRRAPPRPEPPPEAPMARRGLALLLPVLLAP
jgi:hypothetical protein